MERIKEVAVKYRFTVNSNLRCIFLNKNFMGGRFTKRFDRKYHYDDDLMLTQDPEAEIQLENHVIEWIHKYGPVLESIQRQYIVGRITP